MQNAIFDNTVQLLGSTLNYSLQRHKVIAQNIANIETPNYKAMDLPFTSVLKAAVERNRDETNRAPQFGRPRLIHDVTGETRLDGNNVNAENEMIKMMRNSGLHTMASDLIKYKFTTLKEAIRPGR